MVFGGRVGGLFTVSTDRPAPLGTPTVGVVTFTRSITVPAARLPGTFATFRYTLTLTGELGLVDPVITDDNGTPFETRDDFQPALVSGDTDRDGVLDPGETWVYEWSYDIESGRQTSTATLTGILAGQAVSATATSSVEGIVPNTDRESIGLVKLVNGLDADTAATGPSLPIGSTVTFTYLISDRSSGVTFTGISIADGGLVARRIGGDLNGNGRLDTSETWIYQATATVVAGPQCSTATASAPASDVSPTEAGCYTGVDPEPPITQTIVVTRWIEGLPATSTVGGGPVFVAGRLLRFTYWLSDPGPGSLAGVSLVDDRGTPSDPSDDLVPTYVQGDNNSDGILDPGEIWVYTATATPLTGATCTSASAIGTAGGTSVTSSALACYTGLAPDPTDLTSIFGGGDTDEVRFDQTYLGAKTRVYGGAATTAGLAPDGDRRLHGLPAPDDGRRGGPHADPRRPAGGATPTTSRRPAARATRATTSSTCSIPVRPAPTP